MLSTTARLKSTTRCLICVSRRLPRIAIAQNSRQQCRLQHERRSRAVCQLRYATGVPEPTHKPLHRARNEGAHQGCPEARGSLSSEKPALRGPTGRRAPLVDLRQRAALRTDEAARFLSPEVTFGTLCITPASWRAFPEPPPGSGRSPRRFACRPELPGRRRRVSGSHNRSPRTGRCIGRLLPIMALPSGRPPGVRSARV